jgi:hypothetical protein
MPRQRRHRGGTVIAAERDAFSVIRGLPHGHVAAALGTARRIGLDRMLGPEPASAGSASIGRRTQPRGFAESRRRARPAATAHFGSVPAARGRCQFRRTGRRPAQTRLFAALHKLGLDSDHEVV